MKIFMLDHRQSLFPKREGEAPAEPRIPEKPARREAVTRHKVSREIAT
jgi:hypothetical protein